MAKDYALLCVQNKRRHMNSQLLYKYKQYQLKMSNKLILILAPCITPYTRQAYSTIGQLTTILKFFIHPKWIRRPSLQHYEVFLRACADLFLNLLLGTLGTIICSTNRKNLQLHFAQSLGKKKIISCSTMSL